MNRLYILVISAALLGAATPALADPALGGFHVDGEVGLDHFALPNVSSAGGPAKQSGSSRLLVGVGAGYDVRIGGPLVAGVDANLDFAGRSACDNAVLVTGDSLCTKLKRDVNVGARLGVTAGKALIYGRVAYDNFRVGSDYLPAAGGTTLTDARTFSSPQVGGGIEYDLGNGLFAKTEYRYDTKAETDHQQQVIAGLGFKF